MKLFINDLVVGVWFTPLMIVSWLFCTNTHTHIHTHTRTRTQPGASLWLCVWLGSAVYEWVCREECGERERERERERTLCLFTELHINVLNNIF